LETFWRHESVGETEGGERNKPLHEIQLMQIQPVNAVAVIFETVAGSKEGDSCTNPQSYIIRDASTDGRA
jgi:hypothetical protein